ncbi:MAG: formylglycine-generating enzyme family protein [Planctomycetes bacterium]|nr:formylglycine-generating enzyme family protein [Planctomycetota bacterium]
MHRAITALLGLVALPAVFLLGAEDQKRDAAIQKNPKDGATLILLPAGVGVLGTDEKEIDDQFRRFGYQKDWKKHALDEVPRHRQAVKQFLIYKYEVTNAQYKQFVDATRQAPPSYWKSKDYPPGKGQHPVVGVSWEDARAYCRWAGTRLPTEAEWEYAARGPAPAKGQPARIFPWGNEWDRSRANSASYHAGKELVSDPLWHAWYKGKDPSSFPLTTAVGSFEKGVSPFGVHDMAGNAWEWCADRYAPFGDKPGGAPKSDKQSRVVKGGSWANVSFHLRCADRNAFAPDTRNLYIGFRCAQDP